MRIHLYLLFTLITISFLSGLRAEEPDSEFRKALPGYDFQFPRDHGSHPEFQNEWWYFTGNLDSEDHEFGFMFTIFRSAVAPPPAEVGSKSTLSSNQLYLGHFALSNLTDEKHRSWERIGRPAFNLAGASEERLSASVGPWKMEMDGTETIQIHVQEGTFQLELELRPDKPFVLHGEDGVHQKADDPGQASHYISYTNLSTVGKITWDNEQHQVKGKSWMDHEFGTNQLSDDQVGWDWFAIQLENDVELMVYMLREKSGSFTNKSSGSIVFPDGRLVEVDQSQFAIKPLESWKSPTSGAEYPIRWELELPEYKTKLNVTTPLKSQEMQVQRYTGTTYWEGAVRVEGTWQGEETSGKGYVELVGYDGALPYL